MDEKKSVDEKFLAVREQLSAYDKAILTAADMLMAIKSAVDLANFDQEKFGHLLDDLIDQGKIDHVVSDLLATFRGSIGFASTVYDLAYGNGKE